MKSKLILPLSLFIAGSLVLSGCKGEAENEKAKEEQTGKSETISLSRQSLSDIGLSIITVKSSALAGTSSVPAKVIPNQDLEAQVGSLVPGRVHQVFAKVGDYVTTGQILMTVEGLDIGAIKAGFLKAKASLDYSKTAFERQKKLFDDRIGSQKALLETQAEYEKALAEYNAEDKRIHSVGLTDDELLNGKDGEEHTSGTLPIKSHINGFVVERNVVVGQFVDATANAFKVIDTRSVWIDGQIYEKDIPKLHKKAEAFFTTPTYHNEKFIGKIIYIGQTVDEQTRTITIRGEFRNLSGKLKPQMFGELKIPVGTTANAIAIPKDCIIQEKSQSYVFIQSNDTTFERRNITTGIDSGDLMEIQSGLKEGEKVAFKGVFYLKSELKKEELGGE